MLELKIVKLVLSGSTKVRPKSNLFKNADHIVFMKREQSIATIKASAWNSKNCFRSLFNVIKIKKWLNYSADSWVSSFTKPHSQCLQP